MFKNVGKKIKLYAKVLFIIQMVISIIAALVLITAAMDFVGDTDGLSLLFIPLILIGMGISILLAYLSVMFLYAYGEITDNTADLKRGMDYLCMKLGGDEKPFEQKTGDDFENAQSAE